MAFNKGSGGSAHERSVFNAAVKRRVAELRGDSGQRSLVSAPIQQKEGRLKTKLKQFWNSTPVWGAISVLAALIISPYSVKIVYGLVWAVLSFEFINVRIVDPKTIRYPTNILFSAMLAVGIIFAWPHLPKPAAEPNLDHSLAVFGDNLADKIATRLAVLIPKPAPVAASPPEIAQYGDAEVYFGFPESSRGTNVTFSTEREKLKLFAEGAMGGKFTARLLPGYPGHDYQEIPIFIRNFGKGAIENGTITISSDRMVDPVTPGVRHGRGYDLVYDFPSLKPYSQGGQEISLLVSIRTNSTAFNPTPILVTIDGKGLRSSHREVVEYSFMPLPA